MAYIKVVDKNLLKEVCECCDKDSLPKDINSWLDKTVFKEHRYLFYKITEDKVLGYCQNCKCENMVIKRVKSQRFINCPNCHKTMKLKNIKFKECYDRDYFQYVTKLSDENFILRTFRVERATCYLDVKYHYFEMQRLLFKLDFFNSNVYFHKYYREYNLGWTLGYYKNMAYTLPDILYVYNKNLTMFNIGHLKYLPLSKLCLNTSIDLYSFFKSYYKFPQYEYLIKLKLYNLVSDFVSRDYLSYRNYNAKENNIIKFLKLEKEYYNYLLKNKLNSKELDGLYVLQKYNIKPSKKDLEFIIAYGTVFSNSDIFKTISYTSLKNYYFFALRDSNNLRDYKDYIENAKILKYDLTNTKYLKPKNFKLAHDMAYMKVQSIKNKTLYDAVQLKCKKYQKLNYIGKMYSIVVPKNAEDIIKEGKDNHNCVGTYLGRVKNNNSIICFVRHTKEKEKSFYTLELDPRDLKVVQCRGYKNSPTAEDSAVQKFVQTWRKKVVLKMLKAG